MNLIAVKNIIVKDYLYCDNYIFGTFHQVVTDKKGEEEILYILDDGDIYSEKSLVGEGWEVVFVTSEEIIEAFKTKFKKEGGCRNNPPNVTPWK